MKTKSTLFLITTLLIISYLWQQSKPSKVHYPAPTNGETIVKTDADEGDNQTKREAWFELMHQAAPGTDWKAIEAQTARERAKKRLALRQQGQARDGQEVLADGNLVGEWFERGSDNQSGNVGVTEYDVDADMIYTVSGGGSLFRGARDGSNWEVVNQDYRFSDRFLKLINVDGNKRLLAAIDRYPHYSDDMGLTWTKAGGNITISDDWGDVQDPVVVNHNGQSQVYLLSRRNYWDEIRFFASEDNGESYFQKGQFNSNEFNSYSLCNPHHTDDVYLFSKGNGSNFSKINLDNHSIEQLSAGNFSIGDSKANMVGSLMDSGEMVFYIYKNKAVHKTVDFGANWTFLGNMPQEPWGVGIYVSKFDAEQLMMGEVECHRSSGNGVFWNTVNGWGEYYGDVLRKLHADIMYFNEFETADGTAFGLVSNHGGLSISYNNMTTFENIGLSGLNVSQYYDVRTDPNDPDYIYAGAQDQGFQRGVAGSYDDIVNFDQVISGDYGHIAFSNNGKGMWTVYPDGAVSYYANAQFGGPTAGYTIDSENESVWIPPVIETPDPTDNTVLVAGGDITGGEGSHIIKMRYWAGSVQVEQYDFDFKAESTGEVSAIEVSPMNDAIMYASTTNGFFYYSIDAGETWEQSFVSVPEPHYLYGTSIYASTIDENTVYIAGSGYSNAAVFVSTDNGQTFAPFNEGLPKTLVFEIVANEDESMFFAAAEAGAYVYIVSEGKWYDMLGEAAPNQTYWSVEYLPESQTVRYGTYGRGIWDFQMQWLVNDKEVIAENSDFKAFPNPNNGQFNLTYDNAINTDLVINIFDVNGQLLQQKNSTALSGKLMKEIDLTDFPKGIYLIQIKDGEKMSNQRVVVQ